MLGEQEPERQFRVLVTTPEKLDLMLRGGWERQIGRPLTLVIVDEAHGIGAGTRGLRLELLLATINRESPHAQFLLLTPFVPNGQEIARWLDPVSHKIIELGLDWVPNDRVIAICQPCRGRKRGDFTLRLETQHTTRNTLTVPEGLETGTNRPLGLPWSAVSKSPGKLAAATAEILREHGTIIVLVNTPNNSWGVAETLKTGKAPPATLDDDLSRIQEFLSLEMGTDFPLASLLEHGIGVHHSGLSDDTRTIVEWLAERAKLDALVATTTIAQGVNFPVSGVVFSSFKYPYGEDMPASDFWNIAGRAGRVDQGDIGIIALAGTDADRTKKLKAFVARNVEALNSTLIEMVKEAAASGGLHELEKLAWEPRWSAFLQYLAHTYRQIGDHDSFVLQIEQVLRGTLGFRSLRPAHRGWADQLVDGVSRYAERIRGQPLGLVDATGFSWESVRATLARIRDTNITADAWSPELFGSKRDDLRRMMGVLLDVPELREPLKEVTGGSRADGDTLARIVCDWVRGRSISSMAREYFSDDPSAPDPRRDVTRCCRNIFGRLTQTASWGLAALQSLTVGDSMEALPEEDRRTLRNLPARVYYGVNSDRAVALRLLGVPRLAAEPLARELGVDPSEPLHSLRASLREVGAERWRAALGEQGTACRFVWRIIEGEA